MHTNQLSKTLWQKGLAIMLGMLLLTGSILPAASVAAEATGQVEANGKTEAKKEAAVLLQQTVEYYRANQKAIDWWALVGLAGAGENLQDGSWQLPVWVTEEPELDPKAKNTDHIGPIFGLLAAGKNPAVAWDSKRNLFAELASHQDAVGSFGGVSKQAWAITALSAGERIKANTGKWDAAAKNKALEKLLEQQNEDGGFGYAPDSSDVDTTGFVLIALGQYQDNSAASAAIARAEAYLLKQQLDSAGFGGEYDNANTLAAAITGISAAGLDPAGSKWFKQEAGLLQALKSFSLKDGSYSWMHDPLESNVFATKQVLVALADLANGSVWNRIGVVEEAVLDTETKVTVAVDGLDGVVYTKTESTIKTHGKASALDALKQALDQAKPVIPYHVIDYSFGSYVSGIANVEAGSLGGWDGWVFEVNGKLSEVGVSDYKLKDGDFVHFYYSSWPALSVPADIAPDADARILDVKLVGDTFTEEAGKLENWKLTAADSGLLLTKVQLVDKQAVQIVLSAEPASGKITLALADAALTSGKATDAVLSVSFPRVRTVSLIYADAAQMSSWAIEGIGRATALGLVQGAHKEPRVFAPQKVLTRAELATLLVRYAGLEVSQEPASFEDVPQKAWFAGYVATAAQKGLLSGVSEKSFSPNAPVTREQLAVAIAAVAKLHASVDELKVPEDLDKAAKWAQNAIQQVYTAGLLNGNGKQFSPAQAVTREAAAVVFARLYDLKQ